MLKISIILSVALLVFMALLMAVLSTGNCHLCNDGKVRRENRGKFYPRLAAGGGGVVAFILLAYWAAGYIRIADPEYFLWHDVWDVIMLLGFGFVYGILLMHISDTVQEHEERRLDKELTIVRFAQEKLARKIKRAIKSTLDID